MKVHCRRKGGHPWYQAEKEKRRGKVIAQARRHGRWERVREFRLKSDQERIWRRELEARGEVRRVM